MSYSGPCSYVNQTGDGLKFEWMNNYCHTKYTALPIVLMVVYVTCFAIGTFIIFTSPRKLGAISEKYAPFSRGIHILRLFFRFRSNGLVAKCGILPAMGEKHLRVDVDLCQLAFQSSHFIDLSLAVTSCHQIR
jgi:hypothetical protein